MTTSHILASDGDFNFPHFRIPALIQLNNGDILAAFDGRPTADDAPGPNSIVQRRSSDGGSTWEEPTIVAAGQVEAPIHGYSDPSYVYDRETDTLFLFCVYSKDAGLTTSIEGQDDENRQVLSANLSVSHDQGRTWTSRLITDVVKPKGVRGTFASSGHGIQIRRGPFAGRLVQQYAAFLTDGRVAAYSVFSDDHGDTWRMGTPVGERMDENKVVELADGTLMMNSRVHYKERARWVCFSADGGETWSEPRLEETLVDPWNNASIIRVYPDAEPDTPEAQELLFSNACHPTDRVNGSIRFSSDSGHSWSAPHTFHKANTQYSDLLALQDGTFAVLYEGVGNNIVFTRFTREFFD